MRTRFFLLLAFASVFSVHKAVAQQPQRIVYSRIDTTELWFDDYKPAKSNGSTVLFVHGGAFTGGDPANQRPMAEGLNKLGYRVLILKYRLYLQGKDFGCKTATPEKLRAIQTAAEDVVQASFFIAKNTSRLQIDTGRLFLSGSSAGAEAVLNAVYNPFRLQKSEASIWFSQFRFAGLLSFAGALLDLNTIEKDSWIPTLLMHGTRDQLVPFGAAAHRFCKASDAGWMMFFGSENIYIKAKENKLPVVLYRYDGAGHEVSNYMFRKFAEMDAFMHAALNNKIKSKLIKETSKEVKNK